MIKDKRTILKLIFLFILIISLFLNIRLYIQNQSLKQFIESNIQQRRIDYFNLLGTDLNALDASAINDGGSSLIFIFEEPCSPCNRNVQLWNKMSRILTKDNVKIFGVILKTEISEVSDFTKNSHLNFEIFIPEDLERFKKSLKLESNTAKTIFYHDNKIQLKAEGNLDGDIYTRILRAAKRISKKK